MGSEDENKKEDRKEEQEGDASAAADGKGSDGPRIMNVHSIRSCILS